MSNDRFYARCGYESLILQQTHIDFGGLWKLSDSYFIVCPSLDSSPKTLTGKPLIDWFDKECRIIGSPTSLVINAPENAIRVSERTAFELSLLHGEPLTISEVSREISSSLSHQFPLLRITSLAGKWVIEVYRELSSDEIIELEITLSMFKLGAEYEIKIKLGDKPREGGQSGSFNSYIGLDNLALLPSRNLSKNIPCEVRDSYEEDEEFWIDHRVPLLSSSNLSREDVLSKGFVGTTSSCLIDASVFPTNNLRTYLPIYHRIIIAMPLRESLSDALLGFAVSKQELLELVSRGRVQFILPQPVQRYDISFIADVLNANNLSVLFSRKLSAASITETRSRVPFLYPALGVNDKRKILQAFSSVNDPKIGIIANAIGENLGMVWNGMERNISARGAMGNMSHGVGPLLGQIITKLTGKDRCLELITSAMPVEWAAALHSTYFPVEVQNCSTYKSASLCASMYSGIKNAPVVNPVEDFQPFVSGMLTLDNDAPILEIDTVFSPRDIDRLAKLLSNTKDTESRQAFIDKANENILQYEKNSSRLNRLDVNSLGGAAAGIISGNVYLPIGVWVAQYVLSKSDPSIDFGGRIVDWVRGVNAYTSADVVLLSRIRNKINNKN